jgi:hypothetical protein
MPGFPNRLISSPSPNATEKKLRETEEEGNPRVPLRGDSNMSIPERKHTVFQKLAKLFPFVRSPKDGCYKKGDLSLMSLHEERWKQILVLINDQY